MSIIRDGLQSADLDAPVTSPTLNLDFANSQSLDPRITFTRGSIGTRVNRNGLIETIPANQPRFDYDPVTGECKGFLIEEQRTNLLTYSEDFSQGVWTKHNSSVNSNIITSPDNTSNATKLIENTSNAQHMVYRNLTSSVNTTYTFSFFAKSAERQYVLASYSGGGLSGDCVVGVSLIDGSVTTTSNSPENTSVTKLPNGWYRITLTKTTPSASAFQPRILISRTGSSSQAHQGDGTSGIYIWGAQLEAGAFPTSYIPTTASTVTRSADLASMTGTNFSSWYNQTESTILCNFNAYNLMSTVQRNVLQISGPEQSGVNRIQLLLNGLGGGGTRQPIYHNLYQNGPNFADYFGFSYVTGLTKNIMRYKDLDTFVATSDGRIRRNTTSRAFTIPLTKTMTTLSFGGFNGAISKFAYYPKALNDAEIQYLTQ